MGEGDSGCDHGEKMFSTSDRVPSVFSPLYVYIIQCNLWVTTSGMNLQTGRAQGDLQAENKTLMLSCCSFSLFWSVLLIHPLWKLKRDNISHQTTPPFMPSHSIFICEICDSTSSDASSSGKHYIWKCFYTPLFENVLLTVRIWTLVFFLVP